MCTSWIPAYIWLASTATVIERKTLNVNNVAKFLEPTTNEEPTTYAMRSLDMFAWIDERSGFIAWGAN